MFNQQNLLIDASQNAPNKFLPPLQRARACGPIEEYKFAQIKPKKQLKELKLVLLPEKKKFIIRYGMKFNLKDRCVVCGVHKVWQGGDYLRPPIPLSDVVKGRPLRATYCEKHASLHRQLEMLQQQILADEHGLDFKAFVPKPRIPQMLKRGPLQSLNKEDVFSLSAAGWILKPPQQTEEKPLEEVVRLTMEMKIAADRINTVIEGAKGE